MNPSQSPPSQNPQENQTRYPQIPPSNTHPQTVPGNQSNKPGYVPPNQYGYAHNKGANDASNPGQKTQISFKVKELEESLNKKFFFIYKLWVWFIIGASCFVTIGYLWMLGVLLFDPVQRIREWKLKVALWHCNVLYFAGFTRRDSTFGDA